jgi:hypothetical protein
MTLLLAACAAHDPPDIAPSFTVTVPPTTHAPQLAVPWWWRGSGAPDPALCGRLDGDTGEPADGALVPALLIIEPAAIRLGDTELLALTDGELPPGLAADRDVPALRVPLVAAIARHRNLLAACHRPDTPIDVLLAVAPGTPLRTVVHVLINAQRAGTERHFYVVAGGSDRRVSLPNRFTADELRVVLRRADGLHAKIDGERDERAVGPDLAGLAPLLAGRPLGCATLDAAGTPWDQLVRELDALIGLGARQVNLSLTDGQDLAPGLPAGPGEPVTVRVGGTVAALPMIAPGFLTVDRVTHERQFHPCDGMAVTSARKPKPATLEALESLRPAQY